jgi:hypothetical protein
VVTLREASRRGGHLWLLTADSVPASFLQHLAQLALRVVGYSREIYPHKDKGQGLKGVAHPVRLPLGVHQLTGQRYPFLDALGHSVHGPDAASGVAWLLGQHRTSLSFLHAAVSQLEMAIEPDPPMEEERCQLVREQRHSERRQLIHRLATGITASAYLMLESDPTL